MATSSIAAVPSLVAVKLEPDLAPTVNQQVQALTTNHSPNSQSQHPHFINSINELRNLSTALSTFQRRYDELQDHLDFIRKSIDSKLTSSPVSETLTLTPAVTKNKKSDPQPQSAIPPVTETLTLTPAPPQKTENENKNKSSDPQPPLSELESLCKAMNSRGLRKYVSTHLSDLAKLRVEVPAALKLASNPAKLVLESMGGFFRQNSKSFISNPNEAAPRRASIFMLECFLLMGGNGSGIDPAVIKEADNAAFVWRKRIVAEGGISKAYMMDARGLLLFIGCFCIPRAFSNEDIIDLIRASKAVEISNALRRSSLLVARIPELIEDLVKNKRQVEAVDIIYTFGVEYRFPPQAILTSFLQESKDNWKKNRTAAQGSYTEVFQANKKHLGHLKSVLKCLDSRHINHSKVLPGWQINEKICSLEKDIADLDKKIGEKAAASKRKHNETEFSKMLDFQEEKRLRFVGPGTSSYETYPPPIKMLGGGFSGGIDAYSPSSPQLHVYSVGASASASARGLATSSIEEIRERYLLDRTGHVMSGSDPVFRERLIGHGFAGQSANIGAYGGSYMAPVGVPSHSAIGGSSRSSVSDLYRFADVVDETESYRERRYLY